MDANTIRPIRSYYRVTLLEAPEKSAGGVWLPDTARQNWTHATIQAKGPGHAIPGTTERTPMHCEVGDEVLFLSQSFTRLEEPIGMVSDEDLVAVVDHLASGDDLCALNDWVCLIPDPAPSHEGQILLADSARSAPRSGVVEDWGPGKILLHGKHFGSRLETWHIMGMERAADLHPGLRVQWSPFATELAVGRETLDYVFVRAADLLVVEVPDAESEAEEAPVPREAG